MNFRLIQNQSEFITAFFLLPIGQTVKFVATVFFSASLKMGIIHIHNRDYLSSGLSLWPLTEMIVKTELRMPFAVTNDFLTMWRVTASERSSSGTVWNFIFI